MQPNDHEKSVEYENSVQYEKPTIVDYGDFAELTAGSSTGSVTDATIPAGTPYGSITFS